MDENPSADADETDAADHGEAKGAGGAEHLVAANGVEHLSTAVCWELIEGTALGRLALVREDGGPDIFPVNYLAYEGSLYIRTARDSKLLHIAHHHVAALEIDGETDGEWWSVVVRGPVDRVTSDAELRASGARGLHSWSPTLKLFVIRVTASTVTGRRFVKTEGPIGQARAFSGIPQPPQPPSPEQPRATRPTPIPHRTPTGAMPIIPPPG